ncbi:MAG TPA: hypothetical protein VKU02_29795 [Gemmataceae bacterium]|nr:hypothetical protein [Gemmataceae bacterium]
MKHKRWLMLAAPLAFLMGCTSGSRVKPPAQVKQAAPTKSAGQQALDAEITASLAKLSPEDRKLAEEQQFCAVQNTNRLGSMGMPVKVMVKDQPVFLCCEHCQEKAHSDPDKTLAKVAELRSNAAHSPR